MEERKIRRCAVEWVAWPKHFVQAGYLGDGKAGDGKE
jgi:hypothetical protein